MTFGRERRRGDKVDRHSQRDKPWQDADMRAAGRCVQERVQKVTLIRSIGPSGDFRMICRDEMTCHVPMRDRVQLAQLRHHRLPNEGQRQQGGPEPRSFRAVVAESGQHGVQGNGKVLRQTSDTVTGDRLRR